MECKTQFTGKIRNSEIIFAFCWSLKEIMKKLWGLKGFYGCQEIPVLKFQNDCIEEEYSPI